MNISLCKYASETVFWFVRHILEYIKYQSWGNSLSLNFVIVFFLLLFQSFNSKQALNGHIRVHGGGSKSNSPAREYRPPQPRLPKPHGSPASSEDLNGEGFPCKLCGR